MRSAIYRPIALAIVLGGPVAAHAQAVSASPSTASTVTVASEQVYIANSTDQEIIFYVESENTQRTEYRLAPGAAGTLHGEPGDKWLNIEMQPGARLANAAATAGPSSSGAETASSR